MKFGRGRFFRNFVLGKGKVKAGKKTGTLKLKTSQGEPIFRGRCFTCPGVQFRFSRPVRRFFQRRCIDCAFKFNSPDDQARHLQGFHVNSKVCAACFQVYENRVDLFSAHDFLVPAGFTVKLMG